MRTKIGTRLLSLFLTAICVIGLIPTSAFAASSENMPSEITLKKSDYFLDTDGSKTYNSPSFDKPLYLHIINMNVGGKTKVGFCAEHGKQLGNTLIGKKWGNPEPVTNSFIKMMIGYYYCMTDAKYMTDAYKAKFGSQLWTDQNMIRYHNAWIQALCWRALGQGAAIPSDAEGQRVAIAKELMYIANAKNGTSYSDIYTDKYGTTTFYEKGCKVIDNPDCWPDVDVTLYHYIGGNATSPDGKKHYTNDNTQAIMVATPRGEPTIDDYQIVVKKVDSSNPTKGLPGATFSLTMVGSDDPSFPMTGVTGQDGTYTFKPLKAGTYQVTETEAPEGYQIDNPGPYTVTLPMNGQKTVTVTATDTPITTSSGSIRKVDKDIPTMGLAGATIRITNVRPGSYVITEIKAPDGYLIDDPTRTITVTSGDTQTIVFKDTKPGGLIIEKRDSVTKEPLAGATFKVTTSDGRFVAQDGGATSTNGLYTTDANGQIHIVDLDPDTYVVTEVTAPDGYLMDAPSQTVKIEKNDTQTLTFYDTPLGGLTIVKVDSESGKRLEGAKIEVAKLNGEIVGTYVTDKLGVIQLPDLDDGWYQLTEIKAPKGYLLDSTPQKVEVKKGETKTFEFENTASASMLIHKIDSVTRKGIQGVKFVVYDSSMTPIGEYESDDQGYVHLNKTLEDGKYYVREIVAAEGYILDNKVKSFTVLAGDTAMIEWENTSELGQIQVIKTSEGYSSVNGLPAGTPLSGAIFAVYDKQNNVVDKFQTNENGIGSSKKLPLGIYTVKEVQAPANYGLNPTVFTADIEFAGQVVKLNVTDPVITAGVSIKKTGYAQTMNNNVMRWTVSGVRNDSTTSLQSFYWRDTLPTDAVRLTRLVTGTYSTTQTYKVTFTTNLNSQWRTAYDNLSTAKNYTLDMSSAALGLASNEYVTQFMLSFGIVPAGFHQLTNATVDAQTLYALTNGYKFTNKADVGGLLGGNWVQSIARWTTSIYSHYVPAKPAAPKSPKLPRTGY